jgi:raffinose/stachyose/melibiose transport system permease protein/N-acetylglucosamine transport system permease protein
MSFLVRNARPILVFLILILVAISTIYPLFFVFNTALKTDAAFSADRFSLAIPATFDNLTLAWQRMDFVHAAWNSAVTTIGGVVVAWVVCLPVAFAATKLRFPGRNLLFLLVLASMLIPIQTILYPFYLVVRNFHLLNQQGGLIVAFVTFAIPLTTFQMSAYLRSVPDELVEAARMDGASTLQILTNIVVPVCRPVIAVTGIINFIWMWNDILLPVLIMQTPQSRTLMIGAGLLKGQWGSSSTLISAGLALAVVPVLVMFLLAQRQIIQGMTMGAVK